MVWLPGRCCAKCLADLDRGGAFWGGRRGVSGRTIGLSKCTLVNAWGLWYNLKAEMSREGKLKSHS